MNPIYWQGLALGGSLIVAIGAQNAHVLRMGLLRQHALLTAAVCALCDIALITLGLLGMGALLATSPFLLTAARWGGAAYLIWYGIGSLRAAFQANALTQTASASVISRRQALATALGFSLLNPHVYLDTVLLLGSVGGRYDDLARLQFGLGAVSASLLWFFGLAFAARTLAPWLARPAVWRLLDALTALTMFGLAALLLRS
ncbi:LysE/ArgO family amino acid transporter [Jeongeupia naejangsanensis]|uniref:Amino acid transporter n=1 Tax=Jeongeupia naejangsanensis TaxID=613195 RepID=A0ABS2BJ74_9NEIS|nr:LysE/ArgO family amino acid transporter [Jeongeupia naejangsanensis]MBM3115041.1 amino acid transporter [Jeongeupia naejangsanensis]